ncbi:thioesterase-like superfamily-domain-containing protein [Sphaerosporella brunnea]|uniref:Thioesterase-like superfamily-domain-containing protein n=1 Tax=Sphaerosporella brunnea TaxID=1250544 RepID=A0A5J5ETZ3_9PEZI|nr:thioesterase-like superfamily-domain-containing protein [Sphaerosporella brunnea]
MPTQRSSSTGTIKTPPPDDPTVSPIENTIALTQLSDLGPNVFTNSRPQWQPLGARGIYGGSVIAQSLLAAQMTVPAAFVPHSMHCYFVLAGDARIPILYHVDVVRSGRSFHTRTVQARQRGRAIFTTTCSFTLPLAEEEEGGAKTRVAHRPVFPVAALRGAEDCEGELQVVDRLLRQGRIDEELAALGRARIARDPFEWRSLGIAAASPDAPPAAKVMRQWVRSKASIANPLFCMPALAYFSDSWFIGTVGRVNPAARRERVGMMVSLDHTIHFHTAERVKLDEWLLVETESPWAGEERGLVTMKVWTADGTLVASCLQEGIVRLKDGREGEVQEAGTTTPTVDNTAPQAKL